MVSSLKCYPASNGFLAHYFSLFQVSLEHPHSIWIFGMKYGIEKGSKLIMKREKKIESDGIKHFDDTLMKALRDGEVYK